MKSSGIMIIAFALFHSDALVPCKPPSAPDCSEPDLSTDSNELSSSSNQEKWIAYQKMFNKSYTAREVPFRYRVWLNNTLAMMKTNSESHSFSLGWTVHSDMTLEEIRSTRLGYKQQPPNSTHRLGFPYLGDFHFEGNVMDLASEWDWTRASKAVVTPVKDQGKCGSCWTFSATGALEGALAVGNGWMKSLSEQQILDCDTQETGCSGGFPSRAMNWAKTQNVCSEDSYSYRGRQGYCHSNGCKVVITSGSIWGAYRVNNNEASARAAVMQRPLSIVVATGGGFQHLRSGIFNSYCGSQLDHAILMVGYGNWNGQAYWKVKNSWGTAWGIDGYGFLVRGGQGTQQCGILSEVNGVYVYGPYNPKFQLRGLRGELVSPPETIIV